MDELGKRRTERVEKIIAVFALILLFCVIPYRRTESGKSIAIAACSACAVAEVSTGRLLYGENCDARLPMASTTKVLTALTVLQNVEDLDAPHAIPAEAVGIEGSSIYLKAGERLSVRELLYGLMLRSGNDSAVALAIIVAGSVTDFCCQMNKTATQAGAVASNFVNPHGLHDDMHYTTAQDLAAISACAMRNAEFKRIVSTKSVTISGEPKRYLQNKNKMLWNYEGATGVKTGYTKVAGRCLVSSAERNGMELVCVVLNTGDMWEKSARLMDEAYEKYVLAPLFDIREVPKSAEVEGGKLQRILLSEPEVPLYPLCESERVALRVDINISDLRAPVAQGEECGEICVRLENRLIYNQKLYSISATKAKKGGIFR